MVPANIYEWYDSGSAIQYLVFPQTRKNPSPNVFAFLFCSVFVFIWSLITQCKMHKSQVYLWNAYGHISITKMIEHFYLPKKFPSNYIDLICISQKMTNIKHLVIIAEQFAFTLNCWFISFVPFPSCVIIFASQILGDLYYLGFLLLYFSQCFIIFCFCLWHFLFMKLFFLLHSKLICIFCHWVGFSVVIFPLLSFSFFIIFHLNIWSICIPRCVSYFTYLH